MAEEENVRLTGPSVGYGGIIAVFDTPQVPVGEENAHPIQGDLLFQGVGGPTVAVAGDHAHGDAGVGIGHRFGVLPQIAQVDDLIGGLVGHGGEHTGHRPVRIRKNKNFQNGHLCAQGAYT